MRKLVEGIIDFRKSRHPQYREIFARLALGQRPDSLFIACSDSRVAINVFASTNPGDLFVIRNVGNLVAPCGQEGVSIADESEAAAIEIALNNLQVKDIIICGHSECAAMRALAAGRDNVEHPHLRSWLRHAEKTLARVGKFAPQLERHNELSQLNVLQQIENIKSYPVVRERIARGELRLHGFWFDLTNAEVLAYDKDQGRFVVVDETTGEKIIGESL